MPIATLTSDLDAANRIIEMHLILRDHIAAAIAAERERCAEIVEDFPYQMMHMWERPGGPPGNGYRETTHEDIAAAIRAGAAVGSPPIPSAPDALTPARRPRE